MSERFSGDVGSVRLFVCVLGVREVVCTASGKWVPLTKQPTREESDLVWILDSELKWTARSLIIYSSSFGSSMTSVDNLRPEELYFYAGYEFWYLSYDASRRCEVESACASQLEQLPYILSP